MLVPLPFLLLSPVTLCAGALVGVATWAAVSWPGGTDRRVVPAVIAIALAGLVMLLVSRERQAVRAARDASAVLDHERASMRAILDQLPVGIVTVDTDTNSVVDANAQARGLLEHPLARGAAASTVLEGFAFHGDGRPVAALDVLVSRALSATTAILDEVYVIRRDGSKRELFITAMTTGGRSREVVLVAVDVTGPSDVETPPSNTGRLDDLGALSASMAHELGNLLTAIVCHLELLATAPALDAAAHNEAQEALTCAHLAADHTRRLVVSAASVESLARRSGARSANRSH